MAVEKSVVTRNDQDKVRLGCRVKVANEGAESGSGVK